MARLPLVDFKTVWRPYQLVPSSGKNRTLRKSEAYLSFMGDPTKVHAYFTRLRHEGSETDIRFEFEGKTSGTFDAHRLAEWALDQYGSDAQDTLVTRQFEMFFERGEPPNDLDRQVDAASKAGLDAVKAKAVLDDQAAYADVTRSKLEAARREGVSGVPCFRIVGVEVATGAQGVDFWEHKLRQKLMMLHKQAQAITVS